MMEPADIGLRPIFCLFGPASDLHQHLHVFNFNVSIFFVNPQIHGKHMGGGGGGGLFQI